MTILKAEFEKTNEAFSETVHDFLWNRLAP